MNYRRLLIRLCTFLGGIYYFLYFVLPERIGGSPDPESPGRLVGGFSLADYQEPVANGFIVLGSMALGLGLINIVMVHGSRVVFLRKGWSVSLSLLGGFLLMILVTFVDWGATRDISRRSEELAVLKDFAVRIEADYKHGALEVPPIEIRLSKFMQAATLQVEQVESELALVESDYQVQGDEVSRRLYERARSETHESFVQVRQQLSALGLGPLHADQIAEARRLGEALSALGISYLQLRTFIYERSVKRGIFKLFFEGLYVSLGAAMFSLLGFYIAAAAYRAFRVKSVESVLMIAAAFLVMLGQIPFGLWLWEDFPELRQWLLQVPNAAASRAIEMGAAIAGLIMAFRMWLTIEAESYK